MGKHNQQLIDAGVMVDGAGLQSTLEGRAGGLQGRQGRTSPTARSPRRRSSSRATGSSTSSRRPKPSSGPRKIPFQQLPNDGRVPEVEVRQFFEIEDFPNAPADVVEQEKKHFGRK